MTKSHLHSNGPVRLLFLAILFFQLAADLSAQVNQIYHQNQTPTYSQVIEFYNDLALTYDQAQLIETGMTDAGLPLHALILDARKRFDSQNHPNQLVILINNAIHPGEPCGVDASMNVALNLLKQNRLPENVLIVIIPVYNVGGALNRNSFSRANQNGPEAYGFRGNAKNLDLNRDFIKCDAQNTEAFIQLFQTWKPHVFIDTHTSNGADYQHVMTLLTTQKDKLNPLLSDYLIRQIEPALYQKMDEAGFPMVPYVNPIHKIPDNGLKAYMDYPRYSTGYTALFNTIGFTTEAHMFKSFEQRVEATRVFLELVIDYASVHAKKLIDLKKAADLQTVNNIEYPINWQWNDSLFEWINFKGYEAEFSKSELTGYQRLHYNRNRPFEKNVPFYRSYDATEKAIKPHYYIIPQAWQDVIHQFQINQIPTQRIKKDTLIWVSVTRIVDFETSKKAYEGHFPHASVQTTISKDSILFRKGDWLISMGHEYDYYVVSVLEPKGADSFFRWNYFDPILQQKEWFSPYVFEDEAIQMLESDPELQKAFDQKMKTDTNFSKSEWTLLNFIYQRSERFEKTYRQYPVYRVE